MDTDCSNKCFVLDTNVLIHDPNAPLNFMEHMVLLNGTVLEELDKLKSGRESIAADCRQAIRCLESILGDASPDEIKAGVPIYREGLDSSLGKLSIQLSLKANKALPDNVNDNIIINDILHLKEKEPDMEYILVSKDINMRLKARAAGLEADDYQTDRIIDDIDKLPTGIIEFKGSLWKDVDEVKTFRSGNAVYHELPMLDSLSNANINEFIHDEFDFVGRIDSIEEDKIIVKELNEKHIMEQDAWGLTPNNLQQSMALDLLLDDDIDFVSINGAAGSGKSILAIAAALELTVNRNQFEKIIVTRSLQNMDEEIGFLPGEAESKLAPWMGSVADSLESLHLNDESTKGSIDYIMDKYPIQLEGMTFMRGRSFQRTLLIIEECQNMTAHQIKSMLTRIGMESKAIVVGSNNQIDTPYLNPLNSGLTYMTERMKSYPRGGHITLEGIQRSELAEFAEEHL